MKLLLSYSLLLCTSLTSLHAQATKDTTFIASGNPIIKHKFTADPAALVFKGKVYIYTGHDVAPEKRNGYEMHEWLCFSTPDMKTFTEHPSPLNVKAFKWQRTMHGRAR